MTTLSIPLKDIHLGGEGLTTLLRDAFAVLGPSIPLTIEPGTACITFPHPPPHLVADAHKTFDRAMLDDCFPRILHLHQGNWRTTNLLAARSTEDITRDAAN